MARNDKRFVKIATVALALLAGACAKDIAATDAPPMSFAHEPAFSLPGSAIMVEDVTKPMGALPSVERAGERTPADIARAFARDRLRAKPGDQRPVVLRILESSVVEEGLPTQYGYLGYLAGEQNRQFSARLKVEIVYYDGPRQKTPNRIDVEATASRPLGASVGPNGSAVEYYTLMESLARDFDGAASTQLSGLQAGF
jgi:hypothetical protein